MVVGVHLVHPQPLNSVQEFSQHMLMYRSLHLYSVSFLAAYTLLQFAGQFVGILIHLPTTMR